MNANYFERQIAHHERAANGFQAEARKVREQGDLDRASRLVAMARAERDEAERFRKRLARI